MTQKQLIEQIKQLPIADRVALLEEISRSLREELEANDDAPNAASDAPASNNVEERARKASAISRLRGIAKPDDGPPPSDEELNQDYIRHLTEKYS